MKKTKILYPNLEFEKIKKGDTYDTLGAITHHTKSTISKKMRGISDWSIEDIELLCNYFKKDYYYLFERGE